MKKVLLITLLWIPFLRSFTSLSDIASYMKEIPEFPASESVDLEHPDYSALYRSLEPRWWQRMLTTLRLRRQPAWQENTLLELLDATQEKEQASSVSLTIPAGSTILTFGPLYGAFHSLARALLDMKDRGFITETFTLKEGTYLVFLGNTIDFGAYSLETLTLILTLLQENSERVIFLEGDHESKKNWHDYGLYNELVLRTPEHKEELAHHIDTFFAQLPTRLTVTLKETGNHIVFTAEIPEIIPPILITGDELVQNYQEEHGLYKKSPNPQTIIWQLASSPVKLYRVQHRFVYDTYSVITLGKTLSSSTISLYYSTGMIPFAHGSTYNLKTGALIKRGLLVPEVTMREPAHLSLEQLAAHIKTLSSRTMHLKKQLALIKRQLPAGEYAPIPIEKSELLLKLTSGYTLTHQELQKLVFDLELLYNTLVHEVEKLSQDAHAQGLLTALPQETKAEEDALILGSSLDVSKSAKGLGIPFRSGMSLKVNKQNREGGINGKRVQIIFLDDGYIPSVFRKNIFTLLDTFKTPLILAPVGSPTLFATLDLIKDKKILVLFPQSGSPTFRQPDLRHIIHFRASFHDEGKLLTEYVLENYNPKNFAFFYQDDEFGISILNGAQEALKGADIPPPTKATYQANTTYFKPAATKIREANPDAIGFFATGPATLQLIRSLGAEFLSNKILYAVSSVGDTATIKVLKDRGFKVIMGRVVPDPKTSNLEIVKEYRNELKKQGLKEDVFSLETYITTSLTFDALSKIKGPITMQNMIDYFEHLKNYSYKGLKLNFNPEKRSLAHTFWINTGEGPWIEKTIG